MPTGFTGLFWRLVQAINRFLFTHSRILPGGAIVSRRTTNATEPALLVALTPSQLQAAGRPGKARVNLEMGKTRWLASGQQEELENSGDGPVELLRFEFKTKPFNDPNDRMDVHDHNHPSDHKQE
jgi:hypothetical protein